ncbi:MAG: ABC transporter permease [Truepera sp.]|nr:ABC transporter permease [Truepera sp.]
MSALVNVIRAELFKAARKRRLYLLAILLWVIFPLLLLFVGWLLQTRVAGTFVDNGTGVGAVVEAVAAPLAISRNSLVLLGNSAPVALLIVAVVLIAALLIGDERSQNMWKTVLTVQPDRLTVLLGKLIAAMLLLGLLLLGSYLSGPLFGALGTLFLPTSFSGDWGGLAGLYLLQWLYATAAMLFTFLMIWLLRSNLLGIVAVLFLPGLLEGMVTFYQVVVGFDRLNRFNAILQTLRLRQLFEELPRYFFTTNLYTPSRLPLNDVTAALGLPGGVGNNAGPFAGLFDLDLTRAAWVLGLYAALFAAVLIWSFTRRDIA